VEGRGSSPPTRQKLAKFDLIDINKYRYSELAPNTWAAIKAFNPNIGIYLYEDGTEASNFMDTWSPIATYGSGRYNVSRGHSMGSLNGNNPGLFLLDSAGNRIYNPAYSDVASNQYFYLMDFGSPAWQAYWLEAVKADIINQPWVGDGVHADNCVTFPAGAGIPRPQVPHGRRLVRRDEHVRERDLRRTAWLWPETLVQPRHDRLARRSGCVAGCGCRSESAGRGR